MATFAASQKEYQRKVKGESDKAAF